jgi:hypothetical protein
MSLKYEPALEPLHIMIAAGALSPQPCIQPLPIFVLRSGSKQTPTQNRLPGRLWGTSGVRTGNFCRTFRLQPAWYTPHRDDLVDRPHAFKRDHNLYMNIRFAEQPQPHGGARPFLEKSTGFTQQTLGPCVVQIWSRYGQISTQQKHRTLRSDPESTP